MLKMPLVLRRIIALILVIILCVYVVEEYSSLDIISFSDIVSFRIGVILCSVGLFLITPSPEEVRKEVEKRKQSKIKKKK